ncbi:hypothetical protein, partial [Salinibacter ruber]|uniref:hypothetical protein n=1 Tax=Salinibacter ruber TaxID=146919 RepID=UPI00216926E8
APIETEIALLLFLFGLARKNTHILHHSTSRSQTSRCVEKRTEAAGNDDRRPAVTATRMVFAAYNGKIVPWGCLQADGPTGPGIGGGEDCHRGVFGWILSVVIGKHFFDLIV